MKKLLMIVALVTAQVACVQSAEKQIDPELLVGVMVVNTQNPKQVPAEKLKALLHNVEQVKQVQNAATVRLLQKNVRRIVTKLSIREIITLAVLHEYLGDLERAVQHDSYENQTRYNMLRNHINQVVIDKSWLSAKLYIERVFVSNDIASLMNLLYLAQNRYATHLYNRLMGDRDARMYLDGKIRLIVLRNCVIRAAKQLNNKEFEALALCIKYPNENRFTDRQYSQFAAMSKKEFMQVLDDACDELNCLINTSQHAGILFEILEKAL